MYRTSFRTASAEPSDIACFRFAFVMPLPVTTSSVEKVKVGNTFPATTVCLILPSCDKELDFNLRKLYKLLQSYYLSITPNACHSISGSTISFAKPYLHQLFLLFSSIDEHEDRIERQEGS